MILEQVRLDGRPVLVSGAGGGGIGSATSCALAEAGAQILAVDVSKDALEVLGKQLTELGADYRTYLVDARDTEQVDAVMASIHKDLGPVPHLVNVIGGIRGSDWGPLEQSTEEQLEQVLDLNLACAFRFGRRVAQGLIDAGKAGSIVNVSSISAFFASERGGLYAIAKGGVEGLTRAMAVSWANHGIRVNGVAPGRVDTAVILEKVRKGDMPGPAAYVNKIPMGRTGTPQETAGPILFLLSDLARYVTGQTLLVDGGASVRFMINPD